MLKGFKYRLYPTEAQAELLNKHFGAVRFVYNLALETKLLAYNGNKRYLSYFDLAGQLTDLKKELNWLNEVNSQSLQMALRNLDISFKNFFKGLAKFPNFRKKHNRQSFQCPQHVTVDKKGLWLPKFRDPIRIILHRPFHGTIKTVTISKTPTNKYFASILVDMPITIPAKQAINNPVGIDLGVKSFIVTSEGIKFDNPKYLQRSIDRLKILQKRLSKKQKGSKKRERARLQVALLHEKVYNQRNDFLHKVSDAITKQYDTICIENLQVANMVKNHHLARAIMDCGWSQFTNMLKYKSEWRGVNLLRIGTFDPSTKLCSVCGSINKGLTLADRIWTCPDCGTVLDRDVNAAVNILNFGLRYAGVERPRVRPELPTLVGTMKGEKIITS
ncbi:MAG: RNA-guided endonuclease TnpB family protein [Lutibacter sp.]|jgi:putative transposase